MNNYPRTYAFVRPNPAVAASKRFASVLLVILTLVVLASFSMGSGTLAGFVWSEGFVILVCLIVPVTTFLQFRFAKGVDVGADGMVVHRWLSSKGVYPWPHVASVTVVTGDHQASVETASCDASRGRGHPWEACGSGPAQVDSRFTHVSQARSRSDRPVHAGEQDGSPLPRNP